jgi:hypothetical protein
VSIAGDLIRSLDAVALAFDLELDLDPWQAEVLRSDRDVLVNGARQTGKSTVSALKVLHQALYVPRSLCLLVAPALRQSQETFRTALALYKQLGRPIDAAAENTMRLDLENGSRILALPGSEQTLRGYGAVNLLVLDEAARVPDELFHSVTPMLAVSGGQMLAISTPNGRRGWWYAAWSGEGSRWHTIRASECSRISPEFLEQERLDKPDWLYAQEYEGEFTDHDRAAFRGEDIEALFTGVDSWNVA